MQLPLIWEQERRVFSVTDLTAEIRDALSVLTDIWVAGEISGCKAAPSGHLYFTLKDEGAQLSCVCYVRTARVLRFKPKDGVEVVARGRVDVYAQRGQYQMIVDALEPRGYGALQIAFEELKSKLAAEGLFDPGRKRPLPPYPQRIGIVTSPSGAVIQDMLKILTRRFPGLHIRLFPAIVQGVGSADQVCRGIQFFSRSDWAEVVIVARGGGSTEDLWTFNEEAVARAIANCEVPVISAIGHETDFTIADFVADLRAPTPSAAAELVIGTRAHVIEKLDGMDRRLTQSLRYRLAAAHRLLHQLGVDRAEATLHRMVGRKLQRVDDLDLRLLRATESLIERRAAALRALESELARLDLRLRLAGQKRRLDAASARLDERVRWILAGTRRRLEAGEVQIRQLSPLRVLDRGYAIVQKDEGDVLKSPEQVEQGDPLRIRLARGELRVTVKSK